MDNNNKKRADRVFSSIWIFLVVYLILIAGPDYLPRIFVNRGQSPRELAAVLSALQSVIRYYSSMA